MISETQIGFKKDAQTSDHIYFPGGEHIVSFHGFGFQAFLIKRQKQRPSKFADIFV